MFTAKVKADGRFFIGAIELGAHQRDAYALEPDKRYLGHVLDSVPTQTHYVELNTATWTCWMSKGRRKTQKRFLGFPGRRVFLRRRCAVQPRSEYHLTCRSSCTVRHRINLPVPVQLWRCVARESRMFGFSKGDSKLGGNLVCQ